MTYAVTSYYGLSQQLTQETTHILILCLLADLIFTSEANLVMENGIHLLLHPNCHHQTIFAKFDFSVLYPPPHEITVRYYEKADTEVIRR